jgi:repressor LexA
MKLTKKQQQVYDYLVDYTQKVGFPPSIREMCKGLGVRSTSTIHGHLEKLEEKGYIKRESTKNRAITLTKQSTVSLSQIDAGFASIPVVGQVTAGSPILAVENIEDYFPIPTSHLTNDDHFLLKVQGDSMLNAGILDNDYVLVRKTEQANNGDYIVAMVGEESATVKTFYKENNYVRLQPENDAYEPITGTDIQVIGLVKGVFRFI